MGIKRLKDKSVVWTDTQGNVIQTYSSWAKARAAMLKRAETQAKKAGSKTLLRKIEKEKTKEVGKGYTRESVSTIRKISKWLPEEYVKKESKKTLKKQPKQTKSKQIPEQALPKTPIQPTQSKIEQSKHYKELQEYEKSQLQEIDTTLETIKQNKDYQEYKNYMIAEKEKVASLDKQSEAFVQRETNNYLQGISNETIKSMLRPYIVDFLRKVGPEIGQEVLNDPMLQPQTARYQTKTGTSRTKTNYHKIYDLLGLGRYGQSDSAMEELSGLLFEVANRLGYISDEQLEEIRTTIDNANNDIGLDFGTYNIYD